jgi:AraC-like DNA-binding protein
MSFFRNIAEVGKIFADSGKELGQILSDGRKEFTEIMTDGFKEMVIKGNSDYKTSYEKNSEAGEILYKARRKYDVLFDNVHADILCVETLIDDHYVYKKKLYEEIKSQYGATVEEYITDYHLRRKAFYSSHSEDSNPFMPAVAAVIGTLGAGLVGGVVGMDLIQQRTRVKQADAHLQEAKKIKAKLELECGRLRVLKTNLAFVEKSIYEERSLIERLYRPLKEKMKQTEELLASDFTDECDVQDAEQAIEIIRMLEKTLTTQFLQDEAVITTQYQDLTKQLEQLVRQL